MFVSSLLPLPPSSTSLLPSLAQPTTEPAQQQHGIHPQSRRKATSRHNTPLSLLSQDERSVASRKLAIAMYGYSWLKPAGCTKTMLGRREEELEREEVERQLREVELQERMVVEQEEQERREELRRQAEAGEVEGTAERDLDEDVPEAEIEDEEGDEDDIDEDEEEMEGDLDDEIPDADGQESSWVYDTRREPDTESENDNDDTEDEDDDEEDFSPPTPPRHPRPQHARPSPSRNLTNPTSTDAIANVMLDEDELGEYAQNSDIDMDVDLDMSPAASDRDLDNSIPNADSPGWEHTDSELEESEMDISLLPPNPSSTSRNPGTTHEEMRRVSGNRMPPPPLPPSHSRPIPPRQAQGQDQAQPRTLRRNRNAITTPQTDEVSLLISTGTSNPTPATESPERSPRRGWLNPAGARRNLFGGFRGNPTAPETARAGAGVGLGVSSGGLFTPSPGGRAMGGEGNVDGEDEDVVEVPASRTRSGRARLLGGLQGRRRRDGET